MKRYEFYKLAPGADPVEIQEKLWKTFRKLDDELDWLNHPVVFRAADAGRSDFDLMTVVEIDHVDRVADYLKHPLRITQEEMLGDAVRERDVFEHY